MLKRNQEGYYYETNQGKYSLLEGVTIGGDKRYTSDIIFIIKNGNPENNIPDKIIDFMYGATSLVDYKEQYEFEIRDIIEDYERSL